MLSSCAWESINVLNCVAQLELFCDHDVCYVTRYGVVKNTKWSQPWGNQVPGSVSSSDQCVQNVLKCLLMLLYRKIIKFNASQDRVQ